MWNISISIWGLNLKYNNTSKILLSLVYNGASNFGQYGQFVTQTTKYLKSSQDDAK